MTAPSVITVEKGKPFPYYISIPHIEGTDADSQRAAGSRPKRATGDRETVAGME
jgi:hypothetical protein